MLLGSLEYKYAPLVLDVSSTDSTDKLAASAKWIVVLGGGTSSDPRLPINSQLSSGSLVRLVEAIRIHRILPRTIIIFAGGAVFDKIADSEVMAKLAQDMGVHQKDVVLLSDSKDTKDQARRVKLIIGSDEHILVTSASHMPRSMALFRKLGLRPIPAPTDHGVKKRKDTSPGIFFPGASGLIKAERAIHEYLGLIWAKLSNQI